MKPKRKRWQEVERRLPAAGVLVEVGVWKAALSLRILKAMPSSQLILVDPWISGDVLKEWADSGSTMALLPQDGMESIYRDVVNATAPYRDRCHILRLPSSEAAAQIENASIDMVFIDAIHTYDAVRQDIATWLPKVRPGGILGGHDYAHERFPGVQRAVDEAFPSGVTTGFDHTWFIRIPGEAV